MRLRVWLEADHIGSACEQLTPGEAGRVFQRAQWAPAIAAVEIVPVAGVLALQRDDAGALLARRCALDVGEPPFVAHAAAVREQPRHPGLRGCAQPGDDGVEVVADLVRGRIGDVVEVNQGSRAPVLPA